MTQAINTSPARLLSLANVQQPSQFAPAFWAQVRDVLLAIAAEKEAAAKQKPAGYVTPTTLLLYQKPQGVVLHVYKDPAINGPCIPLYLAPQPLPQQPSGGLTDEQRKLLDYAWSCLEEEADECARRGNGLVAARVRKSADALGNLLMRSQPSEPHVGGTDCATLQRTEAGLSMWDHWVDYKVSSLGAPVDVPLPEPPHTYSYRFEGIYGPVWRSSSGLWNGQAPGAWQGLYTADQMHTYAQAYAAAVLAAQKGTK